MCWKDKFLLETLRFGEFYFTAWWCACVEGRVLILGLCWDQLQFYLSTWFLFFFFRSPDDERSWCCARSPSAGCSLIRSNSTIKKFHSTWFHQKRFYLTLDFFFFFSGGGETGRLYRNHLSLKMSWGGINGTERDKRTNQQRKHWRSTPQCASRWHATVDS